MEPMEPKETKDADSTPKGAETPPETSKAPNTLEPTATKQGIWQGMKDFCKPEFTAKSKQILTRTKFNDVTLINKSGKGVTVKIKWKQVLKKVIGCTEYYKECDYELKDKPETIVKVFVAEECGEPPETLCTSGHTQGTGKLHFGFIFYDDSKSGAIFFVVHPPNWKPYQHCFKTNGMIRLVRSGIGMGASIGASAAAGAVLGSVFPGIGTLIGAGIGIAVGIVASDTATKNVGQNLRYIG
mmetsp:Transcript_5292/g.5761  ORF Transcript_5292/g.5761 Transcript_5292/m.5761 type:complete len:241 (-) Transcript_5292:81-803(-)